jgi:hypothetical protein
VLAALVACSGVSFKGESRAPSVCRVAIKPEPGLSKSIGVVWN